MTGAQPYSGDPCDLASTLPREAGVERNPKASIKPKGPMGLVAHESIPEKPPKFVAETWPLSMDTE